MKRAEVGAQEETKGWAKVSNKTLQTNCRLHCAACAEYPIFLTLFFSSFSSKVQGMEGIVG